MRYLKWRYTTHKVPVTIFRSTDMERSAGKPALSVTHNWNIHTGVEEFLDGQLRALRIFV